MKKIDIIIEKFRAQASYIVKDDALRQELMFCCLNAILAFISFFMTVVNLFTGEYILMSATFVYGFLCVVNIVMDKIFGIEKKGLFYCFASETLALLSFFVISGIPNGFSALWFCMIPSFALLIFGLKTGSLFSLTAFLLLVFLLWTPPGRLCLMYGYTNEFMLRFPFFYAAMFFLTLFVEALRVATQKQLLSMEQKYFYLYRHDALTRLYNRYGFEEAVKEETFKDCKEIALLMIDIDDFKKINDAYSHIAGDSVLKELSGVMIETLSQSDIYCRWGGEEFVALLKCGGDYIKIAETLRGGMAKRKISFEDHIIHVTVSIGMCISDSSEDLHRMLTVADKCLYDAKQSGKNRVEYEYIKNTVPA